MRVSTTAILGGLKHESRLEKEAARLTFELFAENSHSVTRVSLVSRCGSVIGFVVLLEQFADRVEDPVQKQADEQ